MLKMKKQPIDWITVNGNHVPIFEGQSKKDAISSFINDKSPMQKDKSLLSGAGSESDSIDLIDELNGKFVNIKSEGYQDFKRRCSKSIDYLEKKAKNLLGNSSSLKISRQQLGKKIGKHAVDYGLDPSKAKDRKKLRRIIEEIYSKPDIVKIGEWRGQLNEVFFYIRGEDVVITTQNGIFISILKGGINNARIKNARNK